MPNPNLRVLQITLLSLALISASCVTDDLPVIGNGGDVPRVPEVGPVVSANWSYRGETGPEVWADLAPEWFLAREGKRQSPIDIEQARLTGALFPILPEYEPSGINLRNTGQTIRQVYFPGSKLSVGNQQFELKSFDFHSPSEHTLQGQQFPLEMQLLHQGPVGQLLSVSLLFEEGQTNAFLDELWKVLPSQVGGKAEYPDMLINVADVLPSDKAYYFYEGSLTEPPCTEGVQWYVLRQAGQISAAQLRYFHRFYNGNFRPTQALNERRVWMTN